MTTELKDCAAACRDTLKTALQTLRLCLLKGGRYSPNPQLLRLLDCAQRCQAVAEACSSKAGAAPAAAEECARACELCAADCELFPDAELRLCAEVCRYCAHACYRVVHAVAA
jgi:hypothetical protein